MPDVPTADATEVKIRFGANRIYMVTNTAMHEMSHTVGLGRAPEFHAYVVNNIFTAR